MGLDVESAGGIAFHAFRESLDCHETGEALQREPTAREGLESQLRREAEAFATLINSKHLPEDVRLLIAESFDHLTDACKDEPESIRVLYPVAMLKLKATGEGSTE
jgi:hypothetical protein